MVWWWYKKERKLEKIHLRTCTEWIQHRKSCTKNQMKIVHSSSFQRTQTVSPSRVKGSYCLYGCFTLDVVEISVQNFRLIAEGSGKVGFSISWASFSWVCSAIDQTEDSSAVSSLLVPRFKLHSIAREILQNMQKIVPLQSLAVLMQFSSSHNSFKVHTI